MKLSRKLAVLAWLLTGVLLIFIIWYKQYYSKEDALTYEVKFPSFSQKLLIASQGSPFKDSIIAGVSDRYKSVPVVIDDIDVAALENTDLSDFDVILIMHRWEAGAPSETVQSFMDKHSGLQSKMVVLTTSWNGLERMKNIDAITGASVVEDAPIFTEMIIKRLDPLLEYKN